MKGWRNEAQCRLRRATLGGSALTKAEGKRLVSSGRLRMAPSKLTSFDGHLVLCEFEGRDTDQYESHQPAELERDPEHRPHCTHVPVPECVEFSFTT